MRVDCQVNLVLDYKEMHCFLI